MSPAVSLLVVGHRSAEHLRGLSETFRAEASRAGVEAEIVHVEHSGGVGPPPGIEVERWIVQENRGYAAGINRAAAEARGTVLLPANPDLRFLPGSLAAILGALDDGWEIVGPRFELEGALFPPAERHRPRDELERGLATRSPRVARRALAARLVEASSLWDGVAPVAGPFLSGALLAFRRDVWETLGRWDEGYFLYFEETDWLWRAARRGLRVAQVPTARVEHRWGGAGTSEEGAGARYGASKARYYRSRFGLLGNLVLRVAREPAPLPRPEGSCPGPTDWWLASPSPSGWPAARLPVGGAEDPAPAARRLAASLGRGPGLTVWSWDPLRRAVSCVRGRMEATTDG